MVEWISNWAEQIIVAVIIMTIIEMILPSGNNKKYIRMVIGIYVLFVIVSPIISKVTNINLDDIDYEKYIEQTDTYQTMSESLTNENNQSIEEIYIQNLKQDMKSKLKEKGYIAENIAIKIELGEENYGQIIEIVLGISKQSSEQTENSNTTKSENIVNSITINKIKIGNTIQNNPKIESKNELANSEIKEIKEYLSSVYEVKEKNIEINGS